MTHRSSTRRTAWLGTALAAAALATTAPGPITTASAQAAPKPKPSQTASNSPTLKLGFLDRNRAGMTITNAPVDLDSTGTAAGVHADIYNGQTKMQNPEDGTESAFVISDDFQLNYLTRGKTYNISVKYTDPNTGQPMTTNTVTFTTQPSTDTQPPTTPTNLRILQSDDQGLWYQLFYDKSTDNVDPAGDIRYVITYNGQLDANGMVGLYTLKKGDVFTIKAV
ncbi:MAG: hypothetical protein J2P17_26555, partial [Mycobacterium sp.]|nr:hypothetical protein [Mycobacterium sp.]